MRWALHLAAAMMAVALAGSGHAGERLPSRLMAPIAVQRPDQALFNEAVLLYSNEARRQNGRAPLVQDAALSRAATDHALNMARLRTHSHVLPVRGQGKLGQRMHRQSVQFRTAAENIAMNKVYRLLGRPIATGGQGCRFAYADTRQPVPIHTYASLAQEAVARWLASPKHRASLLSSSYRRLGAGVGIDPGGPACGDLYLVQDFAD
jgi:uncharacterized protein YkwD